MPSPKFCNTCWMISCSAEAYAFQRASQRVMRTQSQVLKHIVAKNRSTSWGIRYGFASIHTVDDFRRLVPLSQYKDYCDAVARIAAGGNRILTSEVVELLEPTSGTTSGEKLIPYTAGLRHSFQRAIRAWIWDLFYHRPALRGGTAYWSISPLANAGRTTSAGVRIGFDDDSAYLGGFERRMLTRTLAVPPAIALCSSVPAAQYATLFFLLRDPRLALISVWSPVFLAQLLAQMQKNADSLCDDIARGSIGGEDVALLPESLAGSFDPQPRRASELRNIFRELPANWVKRIWPNLGLVSCWADGPSAIYAANLARQLPGIEIQPKGLLATEGVVTIPLVGHIGGALAVRSNFFEFLPVDTHGEPSGTDTVLSHELELNREYHVVLTTAGGLYRYQLNDQVRVVGFQQQLPLLQFVGKADDTMDFVGEKLSAAHAQQVIAAAVQKLALRPTFIELAAEPSGTPRYLLRVTDGTLAHNAERQLAFVELLEQALRSNPGYRYARDLGQLGCLEVLILTQAEADRISDERTAGLLHAGMRHGDIKPTLVCRSGLLRSQ